MTGGGIRRIYVVAVDVVTCVCQSGVSFSSTIALEMAKLRHLDVRVLSNSIHISMRFTFFQLTGKVVEKATA